MKKMLVLCVVVVVLFVAFWIVDYRISAPPYRGAVSDHFDGKLFHNINSAKPKGFLSLVRWQFTKDEGPWRTWVNAQPGPIPEKNVGQGIVRITFINHSTLLIQIDGVNILTDPIWSERASPVSWAGPKRVRPPGIRFENLPPIDAVIVSHNHYDHLDLPTLERLAMDYHPFVYAALGNGRLLTKNAIRGAQEMDWWQSVTIKNGVSIVCVPSQHWSGRGFTDRLRNLWCGYIIKSPSGTIYFAGDTGYGIHFEQITKQQGPIDIALLPIGAFRPRWFMESSHLSPSDAIQAHRVLKTKHSIPIHYGTFHLGDDGETEALDVLKAELAKQDTETKSSFHILDFGEKKDFVVQQQSD